MGRHTSESIDKTLYHRVPQHTKILALSTCDGSPAVPTLEAPAHISHCRPDPHTHRCSFNQQSRLQHTSDAAGFSSDGETELLHLTDISEAAKATLETGSTCGPSNPYVHRHLVATSALKLISRFHTSHSNVYLLRPSNGLSGKISEGVRTSLIIFAKRETTAGLSAATLFFSLISSAML